MVFRGASLVVVAALLTVSVGLSVPSMAGTTTYEWDSPKNLDRERGDVAQFAIDFDSKGEALAIWEQEVGDVLHGFVNENRNTIFASWRDISGTWCKPLAIVSGIDGISLGEMDMFLCENGNAGVVYTVFSNDTQASPNVYATLFQADTGWSVPALIENNDPWPLQRPQIVVWPNGSSLAIWEQGFQLWSNFYGPGVGWGDAAVVGQGSDGVWSELELIPDGSAMAVWYTHSEPSEIRACRYVPGTGWGQEVRLNSGTAGAYMPKLAFDSLGNGMATWIEYIGFTQSVWYSTYSLSSGWSPPARVDPLDTGQWQLSNDLVASDDGEFLFATCKYESASNTRNIWADKYVQGDGWGRMERVENNSFQDTHTRFIDMGTDGAGHAVVVWPRSSDGVEVSIWSSFYNGNSWSLPSLVEKGKSDSNFPRVGVDAAGDAICMWRELGSKPYQYHNLVWSTTSIA